MPLIQRLFDHARNRADHPAMIFVDGEARVTARLSFGQLACRAAALADELKAEGRLSALLIFETGPEFAVALYACQLANVVAVPLPPPPEQTQGFHWRYLRQLLEDTGADLILAADEPAARLQRYWGRFATDGLSLRDLTGHEAESALTRVELRPESPHLLLYTSGSTSAPKGVQVQPQQMAYNGKTCCDAWAIDEDSVLVSWMPHHHSFGLIYNLILPIHAGCTLVVTSPHGFLRDPALWFRMVHDYRGTHGAAATFGYSMCTRRIPMDRVEHLDLSCWRVGLISAEPIRRGVTDAFMARFAELGLHRNFFCALYGLSESGPITSQQAGAPMVWDDGMGGIEALAGACVGPELPGTRIRVVDPHTLKILDENAMGEVVVSGPSVLSGYFRREAINASAFVRLEGETGRFFRTGDQGFLRDGGLYITGRIKEVLIVRGRNFYPMDLEWLARDAEPALKDCTVAAFTVDSPAGDVEVHLVMERPLGGLDDAQAAALIASVLGRELGLTPDAVHWTVAGAIPKTAGGKIRRSACRDLLLDDALTDRFTWRRPVVTVAAGEDEARGLDALLALFARVLQVPLDELDEDAPLSEWPLDSVAVMDLAAGIETLTGRPVKPTLLYKSGSIGELAEHLDLEW